MQIESPLEGTLFAVLSPKPQTGKDLLEILRVVGTKKYNVVIDFSKVDIITGESIGILLRIGRSTMGRGKRLKLCSVNPETKGIFATVNLNETFEFAEDVRTALAVMTG
jgi:anti-anti-sigma factor